MESDVAEFVLKTQARLGVLAEAIIRRTVCVAGLTDTRSIAAIRSEVTRMQTELSNQIGEDSNA